MAQTVTGTLHGNVITLDAPELSSEEARLEGRRVRVSVEPLDDADAELSPGKQAKLWQRWVENGPQGPIEDDELYPSPGYALVRGAKRGAHRVGS